MAKVLNDTSRFLHVSAEEIKTLETMPFYEGLTTLEIAALPKHKAGIRDILDKSARSFIFRRLSKELLKHHAAVTGNNTIDPHFDFHKAYTEKFAKAEAEGRTPLYADEMLAMDTLFDHHPALFPSLDAFNYACTSWAQDSRLFSFLDWSVHDITHDLHYSVYQAPITGNEIHSVNVAGLVKQLRVLSPTLRMAAVINRSPLEDGGKDAVITQAPYWVNRIEERLRIPALQIKKRKTPEIHPGRLIDLYSQFRRGELDLRIKSTYNAIFDTGNSVPKLLRHAMETAVSAQDAFHLLVTEPVSRAGTLIITFNDQTTSQDIAAVIYRVKDNFVNVSQSGQPITAVVHAPLGSVQRIRKILKDIDNVAIVEAVYPEIENKNTVIATNFYPPEVKGAFGFDGFDRAGFPRRRYEKAREVLAHGDIAQSFAAYSAPYGETVAITDFNTRPGTVQTAMSLAENEPKTFIRVETEPE